MKVGTDEELESLRKLVRQGKLFAVQDWLAARKPILYPPESPRWSILEIAANTGFHSMAEVFVKAWPDRAALNRALHRALSKGRGAIARLLVEHGAEISHEDLSDVARCYDKDVMQFFLDRIPDPCEGNALGEAIAVGAKPLIGLFRDFCRGHPAKAEQLAKALKYFVRRKNERGVCLALWMGADPRLSTSGLYEDEEYAPTSALEDACSYGVNVG
jgi:hypothetical protein